MTSSRTPKVGPSRPRDRKAQIITSAGRLFCQHGYHNVTTAQIAASVGITAGALYRHFADKQDLLAHALVEVFDRVTAVAEGPSSDLAEMVEELAATACSRRDFGVLWTRESRHLDDERRDEMRVHLFVFVKRLTEQLQAGRPELSAPDADLLAWCALGVLTSPSYHSTEMEQTAMFDLLRRLTLTACLTSVPEHDRAESAASKVSGLQPSGRREAILSATARLFYERGYQAVTMDDVGAAVGITNAGVYKYFDSKSDLLTATIARASEPLQLGLSRALASATTPAEGLANALDAYVDFAMEHHDLVGILVSEVLNLPEAQRHGVRRAQRAYVDEWVRLLTDARPELNPRQARFVVHATLTVINDVTRTGHLTRRPALDDELRLIGRRLLAVAP